MKRTVAVDVDGVLARYDGWKGVDHIGDPIPGAVEFTKELGRFADVLIFTTRCNPGVNKPESLYPLLKRVKEWLDRHGFHYDEIYLGIGKPIASAYVDNRAVPLTPEQDDEELAAAIFRQASRHCEDLCR